jgi:hypothetical protein
MLVLQLRTPGSTATHTPAQTRELTQNSTLTPHWCSAGSERCGNIPILRWGGSGRNSKEQPNVEPAVLRTMCHSMATAHQLGPTLAVIWLRRTPGGRR